MNRLVVATDPAGLQIAVHAIGDRTIRNFIDALELAVKVDGTSGRRHRIQQLKYAAQGTIKGLAASGTTAAMQPIHATPRFRVSGIAMRGAQRAQEGFAWPRDIDARAT